jgi:hypothetical protein
LKKRVSDAIEWGHDVGSLLVFVNKGNDDDLGIENQFDEVCNPLEAGIRTGIPNIEPRCEVKSAPISGFGMSRTCTALSAVQFHPVGLERPGNQIHRTSIPPSLNEDQIQHFPVMI